MNIVHNSHRLWIATRFFLLGLSALFLAWTPLTQGAQSVTTAWDRSTDSTVTGYKLYYTDVSAGTTSAINAGNVVTSTVSGLLETKTYSFNVVAYNASGTESVPSNVINYTVPGANTAPTISSIADLSTSQNTATTPIPFTIGDAQTAAGSLILSRTSSNPTLIPVANIVFGGSGANRTVTVTPALNQTGTSTITVTVSDGSLTASDTFVLTVNATANTAPTISSIADLSTSLNTATAPIPFTVGDAQTAAGSLLLSLTSSNPTLVPVANIVFGGSGANRTVTATPALNQTGTSTITVTVSDGSLTASKSFVLTVNPAGSFTPVYLTLEAESATLVAPMAISSDPNASAGQYIAPTANDSGTATFTINIPVAGNYKVWCRVLSPNTGQDSFFVSVDGGTEFIYSTVINGGYTSAWQWTFVNADMVNPSVFNFSAGQHSIQLRSREAFTGLDQLLVTNDPSYVPGANTPPTISSIADLSTSQNTATAPIAFTVGDAQTAAGSLIVSRASSNPTLVPTANIVLGGSGANRTVTVTPALNQTGTATITVTVSDGSLTASDSFALTVNAPANTAPTISSITDQTTTQNTATAPIAIAVGDSQTAVGSLTVSGASSNPTLVPAGNIVFGGSGANRTVTVTPALNQTGTATITVTVSEATLVSPMAISSDPNASGGKYIAPTADNSGTATFTINIPVAGTYVVWCKVLSPNNGQDSFFVSVDGGTEFIYSTVINGGYSSAWQWTFVNSDAINPVVFNFSVGQHSIQLRSREAYTALDQLVVTNDRSYVPDVIFTITTPTPLTSSIGLDPAGFVTVTWPSVPGKTYRVMYKNNWSDTAWTNLRSDVTADSSTASQSDYVVGNRFYQVFELP